MSTYSSLKIEEITVGDAGWGPTTTNNLLALQQAIAGMATLDSLDFTLNTATLTLTNTNALQDARAMSLNITATLTGAGTVEVPAVQKAYLVVNNSVNGYAVTIKVAGQTGVSVPNGKGMWVYNNGTDVVDWASYVTNALNATNATNVASGTATGMAISGSSVTPRVVVIADSTSITMNCDTTDMATQANTQFSGLTINAPTGTPVNGQKLLFRLQASNNVSITWNAIFAGSTDIPLPTATTGSGKYDYMGFVYNSTASKWQMVGKVFGF